METYVHIKWPGQKCYWIENSVNKLDRMEIHFQCHACPEWNIFSAAQHTIFQKKTCRNVCCCAYIFWPSWFAEPATETGGCGPCQCEDHVTMWSFINYMKTSKSTKISGRLPLKTHVGRIFWTQICIVNCLLWTKLAGFSSLLHALPCDLS